MDGITDMAGEAASMGGSGTTAVGIGTTAPTGFFSADDSWAVADGSWAVAEAGPAPASGAGGTTTEGCAVPGNLRIPPLTGFARRTVGGSPKAAGKLLRDRVPRAAHASLVLPTDRPDAVRAVEESNRDRVPGLTPIRVGRMAASPFAFLRGSAGLMAHDLTGTPVTGVRAQLCGDAHAANFGLYGDARGRLVMDLNDFDETVVGPWEWDLKRLAASLVLVGRETGADEATCRRAAYDAVGAYRRTMRLLSRMSALDAWNAIADEELVSHADARDLLGTLEKVAEKARRNTSARFAARSTEVAEDGGRCGRRRTGLPGAAVPEPEGQRGPCGALRRRGRRLRSDDRCASGPGPRAQRGPAAALGVLRQDR